MYANQAIAFWQTPSPRFKVFLQSLLLKLARRYEKPR